MGDRFTSVVVDLQKLRDYCLSDAHPRGKHKARVFRAKLGLTAANAHFLQHKLVNAVCEHGPDMRVGDRDDFGQRYILDFGVTRHQGDSVTGPKAPHFLYLQLIFFTFFARK